VTPPLGPVSVWRRELLVSHLPSFIGCALAVDKPPTTAFNRCSSADSTTTRSSDVDRGGWCYLPRHRSVRKFEINCRRRAFEQDTAVWPASSEDNVNEDQDSLTTPAERCVHSTKRQVHMTCDGFATRHRYVAPMCTAYRHRTSSSSSSPLMTAATGRLVPNNTAFDCRRLQSLAPHSTVCVCVCVCRCVCYWYVANKHISRQERIPSEWVIKRLTVIHVLAMLAPSAATDSIGWVIKKQVSRILANTT